MRMRDAAVAAGLALGLMSGTAKAAYVLNIDQVGTKIVETGSGSIDLSGLRFGGFVTFPGAGYIRDNDAVALVGDTRSRGYDFYLGADGPTSFSGRTGGPAAQADESVGSFVGVYGYYGAIYVPPGYVSGSDLGTSISTFNNTSLSAFDLVVGTNYRYTLGDGGSGDTITINVGSVSAVPLPASAPLFGAALLALGAVGYGVKRKKAAATA